MSINLHGLKLYSARLEACEALSEAYHSGIPGVLFIHGYRGGTAIQQYLRGYKGIGSDLRRRYPELPLLNIESNGAGTTRIFFQESN